MPGTLAQIPECEHAANAEPGELGDDRGGRNAFDLHAEQQHEDEIEHDVGQVDDKDDVKRHARIL